MNTRSNPGNEHTDLETATRIAGLMHRKLQGTLDADGEAALESWLRMQPESQRSAYTEMQEMPVIESAMQAFHRYDESAALDDVWLRIGEKEWQQKGKVRRLWLRAVAAAAVVLVAGSAALYIFSHKHRQTPGTSVAARYKSDALPGGNRAVLELADGSLIGLDSAGSGTLAMQGNSRIVKAEDGVVAYDDHAAQDAAVQSWNRVSTPRGGQYQIALPDGSKVWLNAASSLRFPVAFKGGERLVELSGEAYFEIAADAARPFRVAVTAPGKGPMTVDVLGTQFNIQAYGDEPLRTATLVSGKVRVSNGGSAEVLAPGQQAVLKGSHQLTVQEADIDAATAWKNGLISLENASIEEIMRQVERWYDVDVVYEGEVNQQFLGKIPRSMKLSDILKVLESTGWVHFEVNGRTVTVKP